MKNKTEKKMDIVFLAAGNGSRFGKDIPKQFFTIGNVPVFIRCIKNIIGEDWINRSILVFSEKYEEQYVKLLKEYNIYESVVMVPGGEHRFDSLKNGINESQTKTVIVMEAARPFAPKSLYKELIENQNENVMAVMKSTNTPYYIKDNKIREAISTNDIVLSVAPKKYNRKQILGVLEEIDYSKNDDAELMTQYSPSYVFSPSTNIKITTPVDEFIANAIIDEKNNN